MFVSGSPTLPSETPPTPKVYLGFEKNGKKELKKEKNQ